MSIVQSKKNQKKIIIIITGRGATKWENHGSETFCIPPSRQGKTFMPPPTPPTSIWLKLQATALNLPQNLLCPPPPFRMAKTFSAPPPFRRGNTSYAPLSHFVAPLPLPVISDQSLSWLIHYRRNVNCISQQDALYMFYLP